MRACYAFLSILFDITSFRWLQGERYSNLKRGRLSAVQGSSEKRLTGNGEKLNTSQAEPVAASSWAVGQFLSISCETFL